MIFFAQSVTALTWIYAPPCFCQIMRAQLKQACSPKAVAVTLLLGWQQQGGLAPARRTLKHRF